MSLLILGFTDLKLKFLLICPDEAPKQKQKQTARDSDYVIGGAWIPLTMPS